MLDIHFETRAAQMRVESINEAKISQFLPTLGQASQSWVTFVNETNQV